MERISNSKTSASGTKSLTINSKLENQEKLGKNIYFATEAAVTLLLDNIATKKEIKYILQADALLRNTCKYASIKLYNILSPNKV